ncbi:MAG: PAS domain S-box protein, partial [Terriglobales bacterium]
MKPSFRLMQTGIVIVLVPMLFGMVSLVIVGSLLRKAQTDLSDSYKRDAVKTKVEQLSRDFEDCGFTLSGFLQTGSSFSKDRFNTLLHRVPDDLDKLKVLLSDSKLQLESFHDLEKQIYEGLNAFHQDKNDLENANQFLRQYRAASIYMQVSNLAQAVQEKAERVLTELQQQHTTSSEVEKQSRNRLVMVLVAVLVVDVMLTIGLATFFSLSIVKRLSVVTDNSLRLAGGQELHSALSGQDEIAELDSAFHAMSEQLSAMRRREGAIVDNAVDVICSLNIDGRFMSASPSVTSWGFDPEELLGQRIVNLVEPEHVDETLKNFAEARAKKVPLFFENMVRRKDGTTVGARWSVLWSDKDQALFCVVHDVTERQKLERLRDEFVAMVTHDLRTPLTSVQVFHEMLEAGVLGSLNQEGERSLQL